MSYTIKALEQIRQKWDKNYDMMQQTKGTVKWKYYVNREIKITAKEIRIQKALQLHIPDPCPLARSSANRIWICEDCTGWFDSKIVGRVSILMKKGEAIEKVNEIVEYYENPEGEGQKCIMKDRMCKGAVHQKRFMAGRKENSNLTEMGITRRMMRHAIRKNRGKIKEG